MLEQILAWTLIGFGLLALTEGYHGFRRLTGGDEAPGRYWWLAGLIGALGLGLISIGFGLKSS